MQRDAKNTCITAEWVCAEIALDKIQKICYLPRVNTRDRSIIAACKNEYRVLNCSNSTAAEGI